MLRGGKFIGKRARQHESKRGRERGEGTRLGCKQCESFDLQQAPSWTVLLCQLLIWNHFSSVNSMHMSAGFTQLFGYKFPFFDMLNLTLKVSKSLS